MIWPLYELLERCFAATGTIPPTRAALSLLDIADEDAAIDLVNLIGKIAGHDKRIEGVARARLITACVQSILNAVEAHRNAPSSDKRSSHSILQELRNARPQDRSRLLAASARLNRPRR